MMGFEKDNVESLPVETYILDSLTIGLLHLRCTVLSNMSELCHNAILKFTSSGSYFFVMHHLLSAADWATVRIL